VFRTAGMIQLGKWIRLLRGWNVAQMIMVGSVDKTRLYLPMVFIRQWPDWKAGKLWYRTRHDRRTDAMLRALAAEYESAGIQVIDAARFIPQSMADAGPMTRRQPSAGQLTDIAFAKPIVHRLGELDVGQCIAVKDNEVLAVEAIEGTDALIQRAGMLCKSGGWTLVKMAKPTQDLRLDLPTVGLQTIEKLRQAGAGCLAVETGKVILLDKQNLLAQADRAGIAVVGIS
ncbi:MAG: UDP-2,3-diacylglucosamine diphosphatase LpxI, partial [Phycisphaeraceae bacterium]|nr:UDP-2,3-diacylglucosamine diphosphatase LpxI [Phycisphaeraceae bacterium]